MSTVRRRTAMLGALLTLGVLSGCGPSGGLDVGLRHEGVGVFFGVTPAAAPTVAPQPLQAELVPNFPAPLIAPPPPRAAVNLPVATAPPNPCPTPGPTTFPKLAATTTATQPPATDTYQFRYAGTETFNPGTAVQQTKSLPTFGFHHVVAGGAPASDGHYSFDVVEFYNDVTTTTTYLVEPNSSTAPVTTSGTTQAGLYLSQMKSVDTEGNTSSFSPQPPVELMPFPANPGTQFQSAGVDPLTQTAMEEDSPGGQVGDRARVATCGDVVDSWQVEINGRFVGGRGSNVTTFDITFDVATQYGGLLVAEHVKQSGTDTGSGQPYTYEVTETIDSVPKAS
jgi:hypothetical protein